jgi:pyruvate,water dikinase
MYAVRSSGIKEDLECLSFAGQYESFLNVRGTEEVIESVIGCYKSMYAERSLSYLIDNGVDLNNFEMSVIIQEMINSEISGIAFTLNPLTGNDKEIVVEIAEGQGENIVSGRVNPENYIYNWFEEKYDYGINNKLLNKEELDNLMDTLLRIQMFFGYPCDIEFAFEAGKLYILQARSITKIIYSKLIDQWTTTNFKDGGVSATVCKPYMWSLYEYVWEITLKKFLIETKLFKEKDLRKLGDMFYGRPYWNLSVVKEAMANIPGYKEREFDSELGVTITYEGYGRTTQITPKSILKIIQVAFAQSKLTKKQKHNSVNYRNELLKKYNEYIERYLDENETNNIESVWYELIKTDYLHCESTYFWQIFINTIQQPLFKRSLPKCVNSSNYLDLIGGLKNVSHLLPFYDIWEISRKISQDDISFEFWINSSVEEIERYYSDNRKEYFIEELRCHITKYGYHSESELDVSYPCYSEDVRKIIKILKDTVILDDSFSPCNDSERQYRNYCLKLETIKKQVSTRKYKKIFKNIENMREMLWWREELKDISIRFYYLVRIYTIRLAKDYHKNGIIKELDDIWYLKITDLFEFIDKKKSANELKKIIERNRTYYNSFRSFKGENEIGSVFNNTNVQIRSSSKEIVGLGCNNGIVTGTARVVENIEGIDKLQVGDILVTKFTDTGWTSKLAILKGIVTECGGILCHASIISREYGIPCIVSCNNVTKKIKDGSKITLNGSTGEVIICE